VSDDKTSKTYWLHSDVLCKASPVFRTAFDGSRWAEGEESRMKWPECDPKAFDIFVHWLYSKQLPSDEDLPAQEDKEFLFLRVLALGDRALVPSLQAEAYARIRTSIGDDKDRPSKAFVHELYDHDLGSNQLRSYTASHLAHYMIQGSLKEDQTNQMLEETPLFAVDVAKELNKRLILLHPRRYLVLIGSRDCSSCGTGYPYEAFPHPYNIEWYKTYNGAESGKQ
jgi:hypothetical protein